MYASIHIAQSLQKALNGLLGFIPNLIGFFVILFVGYLIAKLVRTAIDKVLQATKVDHALADSDAGRYVARVSPDSTPSKLIGLVVFWFIFLFAISAAIGALKIAALTAFITKVQSYLPNIIAAVLIFVIAAALAGAIGGAAHKLMGDTPTGRIVRAVIPGLIMAIGVFMVLSQLHIATDIVTITYAALLGMLALAGSLAFGLGGREIAGQMLADAYNAGQRNAGQVRADMQTGRDRGREQAEQARGMVDDGADSSSGARRR
jgi:small-conductance mechanosensitive channel